MNADPEAFKVAVSRTSLGRAGKASEIGDVVAFLCSSESYYVTGENINEVCGQLALN